MATPLALIFELVAEDRASAVFKKVGAEAKATAAETAGLGKSFTKMGGFVALAAVGVAAVGTKMAVEFQESTSKIAANAGITQKAADGIGKAFLDTAGKSTFSAHEMANAFGPVSGVIQTLAGHTITAADATKVMAAATTLAEASGNNLDATTADLASVMKVYGIGLKGASDASNVLFNMSKLTNTPLDTLAGTLTKLHAKLGIAAPSLRDTAGLLLDVQNHGIAGSKGIMVVNSGLNTLLGGSKKTTDQLKALGVSVFDSSGKFIGMHNVLEQLTPKLKGMSDQQRLAAESALFGKGAAKALNETILDGAEGLDKAREKVTEHGAAQEAAEKRAKTFAGQMKILRATFADLEVEIGNKVIPVIMKIIDFFKQHSTIAKALAIVIGGVLVASVVAFTASLVAASVAFIAANIEIIAVIAAIAALVAGFRYAYTHSKTFHDIVNKIGSVLKAVLVPALKWAADHWKLLVTAVMPFFPVALLLIHHAKTIGAAFLGMGIVAIQAFRGLYTVVLAVFSATINGAAKAFGWVPGLGGKIKAAAKGFDSFKDSALAALGDADKKLQDTQNKLLGVGKITVKPMVKLDTSGVTSGLKYVINTMNKIGSLSASAKASIHASGVGANARGTDFWRGGLTWVGEEGPELIDLSRGAKVMSNSKSMALVGATAGGGGVQYLKITNYDVMTGHLSLIVDDRMNDQSDFAGTVGRM